MFFLKTTKNAQFFKKFINIYNSNKSHFQAYFLKKNIIIIYIYQYTDLTFLNLIKIMAFSIKITKYEVILFMSKQKS